MLEPTYKHILLVDAGEWDGLVLEDGLFLACQSTVKQKVVSRTTLSSAALGGEGLYIHSLNFNDFCPFLFKPDYCFLCKRNDTNICSSGSVIPIKTNCVILINHF